MNKKVKVVLLTSIILNIVLLSFNLGHCFGPSKIGGFMRQKQEKILSILPNDKKELAKGAFDNLNKIRERKFAAFREELEKVKPIVVAPDFDKQAFLDEISKMNEISVNMRNESNAQIAELLSQLSQLDREKIVEQIKKGPHPFMAP